MTRIGFTSESMSISKSTNFESAIDKWPFIFNRTMHTGLSHIYKNYECIKLVYNVDKLTQAPW